MGELWIAPVGRLIKSGGAQRTSQTARVFLAEYLEDYAYRISVEAVNICEQDGRKIIKPQDIEEARQRLALEKPEELEEDVDELFMAPVRRMLKRAGAQRVAKAAPGYLSSQIQGYAYRVSKRAADLRVHGGETIKPSDIIEAARLAEFPDLNEGIQGLNFFDLSREESEIPTGRTLIARNPILIRGLPEGEEIRITGAKRGRPIVYSEGVAGNGVYEFTAPMLSEKVDLNYKDALYQLEWSGEPIELLVLPRGYNETTLNLLLRIVIEKEFGGLETRFGAINLPPGMDEKLMERARDLIREYDGVVAYYVLMSEVAAFLRS